LSASRGFSTAGVFPPLSHHIHPWATPTDRIGSETANRLVPCKHEGFREFPRHPVKTRNGLNPPRGRRFNLASPTTRWRIVTPDQTRVHPATGPSSTSLSARELGPDWAHQREYATPRRGRCSLRLRSGLVSLIRRRRSSQRVLPGRVASPVVAFSRKARRHGAVEISTHQSTCRAANALLSRAGVTFGAFEELLQRSFVPLALAFKDPRQDRRREAPIYRSCRNAHR
jgi:hypothetical protein